MAEAKFYRCKHCGNIVLMVDEECSCVPHCCGDPMELLVPGAVDAAVEKHVPSLVREGNRLNVKVGEVAHPMIEAHYIQWIAFVSSRKTVIRHLSPEDAPEARFCVEDGEDATVYAYCNLHGLWKAEG